MNKISRMAIGVFVLGLTTLLLFSPSHSTPSERSIILTDERGYYPLSLNVELLEDPAGKLTIERVSSPEYRSQFTPNQKNKLSLGFTNSVYWVRFQVFNSTDRTTDWRLKLEEMTLSSVELYQPALDSENFREDPGVNAPNFLVKKTGYSLPFFTREFPNRYFIFKLYIPPQTKQTLYLRIQTTGVMNIPLSLWSVDALMLDINAEGFVLGLYYGFTLIMLGYNFFIWLSLRDKSYGYCVLFLIANIILITSINGVVNQYLWPNFPEINRFVIPVTLCAFLLSYIKFTITFIDTKVWTPRCHKLLKSLSAGTVAVLLLSFFLSLNIIFTLIFSLILLVHWIIFFTLTIAWFRGEKQARYFWVGELIWIILVHLTLLSNWNLLPDQFNILNRYPGSGIWLMVLFLSLALADRINILKEQHERSQLEALRLKEQLNITLKQTNEELEKRVEERTAELQQAKRIAEAANQAKSQLIANVSHELRTPLNGILGYAQILKREVNLTPKQKEGLDVIYDCGSHLSLLINEMLDLSKSESEQLELYPVDCSLKILLSEVVRKFDPEIRQKQLDFVRVFDEKLPENIYADPQRLRQILNNLLENAVRCTQKGSIRLEVQLLEMTSANSSSAGTAKISFLVEDTGRGLTSEQIDQLFQPFQQFGDWTQNLEGIGLGLVISQKLVRMMGGNIQVESYPERGSKFWFDLNLPISTLEPSTISDYPTYETKNIIGFSGDKCKILVVDDRKENRSVIKRVLESLGFTVQEADNGEEGIEQVRAFQPDLVITDLIMPVKDGLEMIQQLRLSPEYQNLPIIAASGSASNQVKKLALERGCNDLVDKPIQIDELLRKLEIYLELLWIYGEEDLEENSTETDKNMANSLVIPAAEELSAIVQAARIGDIDTLEQEAERLKQLDPRYTVFADKIIKLAEEFNDKAILELIGF